MRHKFLILLLLLFKGLYAQFDPNFDYMDLNFWFDEEQFPPVVITAPESKIYLSTSYEISPKFKYDFTRGVFFINKEGFLDTVICSYPFFSHKDFEEYCKGVKFNPGIWHNRFVDSRLHFSINLFGIPTVKEIELGFLDSTSIGLEDGSSRTVPIYDRNRYDYAFGNATFNRKFPKVSTDPIGFIEFDILVDTILNINRLGRYYIPKRKGYLVRINDDIESGSYLLINLRRNYYTVLDKLTLNLEPEDEYFLLCQRNNGASSKFFCTRFILEKDLVIDPVYTKFTYSQLRNYITINPKD